MALLALTVAGCTLAELDDVTLPTCVVDEECASLDVGAEDPCVTHVCLNGRCELSPVATVDRDGDGQAPAECGGADCDDEDARVFDGAIELCDGLDTDCDGELDGPGEDDDGDGAPARCAGAGVATDCDDADAFTYPGAPELCDGLDNDCFVDGAVRPAGAGPTAEPSEDQDGDGFVGGAATCEDASAMEGERWLRPGDCDDRDASIFPGAVERCDVIDNDCDDAIDEIDPALGPTSVCTPIDVEMAESHTCAITPGREVVCWGQNSDGELGDLDLPDGAAAVVRGVSDAQELALGVDATCVRDGAGVVTCWGDRILVDGEPGEEAGFGVVPLPGPARQITAGDRQVCAVVEEAGTTEVYCWGRRCDVFDGTGCLPWRDGAPMPGQYDVLPPTRLEPLTGATHVAVGGARICVITGVDARVECVDDAGTAEIAHPGPAEELSREDYEVCARLSDGAVVCWACSDAVGCPGGQSLDVMVPTGATQIASGRGHTCARIGGRVQCWGLNSQGQLGSGDTTSSSTPIPVVRSDGWMTCDLDRREITDALDVTGGQDGSCVLLPDGLTCFGRNLHLRLGYGTASGLLCSDSAQPVSVLAQAIDVAVGYHGTCFAFPDGTARCSGRVPLVESRPPEQRPFARPVELPGEDVVEVALGQYFTRYGCLRYRDGSVRCAGGPPGIVALGDNVSGVTGLAAGDLHVCGVRSVTEEGETRGEPFCVGQNDSGQLGVDGDSALTPVRPDLPGSVDVVEVAAGENHACLLTRDGALYCWGGNEVGQIGSRPLATRASPRRVVGLPPTDPPVSLAAGSRSSCAVTRSGSVWCWGALTGGPTPSMIPGASNVLQVALGGRGGRFGEVVCVRQVSGAVLCAGDNRDGRVGDGTLEDRATLTPTMGLSDARDVVCGPVACCATRTSGQTVCWGFNEDHSLADGTNMSRPAPVSTAGLLHITRP